MRGDNALGFVKAGILLLVAGVVAFLIYKFKSKMPALPSPSEVFEKVNPLSENNVFNQGFNAATNALNITGDSRTVGSWLYDVFNADKMEAITAPTPFPVTRKSVIVPEPTQDYTTFDLEDAEMGIAMRGIEWAETPAGAVTGLVRRKR